MTYAQAITLKPGDRIISNAGNQTFTVDKVDPWYPGRIYIVDPDHTIYFFPVDISIFERKS